MEDDGLSKYNKTILVLSSDLQIFSHVAVSPRTCRYFYLIFTMGNKSVKHIMLILGNT